jgi:hypothetical protein
MIIQDDRSPEQKMSHYVLIVGTDPFLTRMGNECGKFRGPSFAAWACLPEDGSACFRWVDDRGDMLRVREVSEWDHRTGTASRPYRPRGNGHLHIYVWDHVTREGV